MWERNKIELLPNESWKCCQKYASWKCKKRNVTTTFLTSQQLNNKNWKALLSFRHQYGRYKNVCDHHRISSARVLFPRMLLKNNCLSERFGKTLKIVFCYDFWKSEKIFSLLLGNIVARQHTGCCSNNEEKLHWTRKGNGNLFFPTRQKVFENSKENARPKIHFESWGTKNRCWVFWYRTAMFFFGLATEKKGIWRPRAQQTQFPDQIH